ncbi:MAG TPA: polysaccharide biosynthesis C-terminal domain-containing protein [bacterium]
MDHSETTSAGNKEPAGVPFDNAMRTVMKKLAKDTLLYVPAKIIPGILGVLAVAVFTRLFDPSLYGQYILVLTTTTIVTAFASQWIVQSVLRYRAQYVANGQVGFFNEKFTTLLLLLTMTFAVVVVVTYPIRGVLGSYESYFFVSFLLIVSGIWFNCLITLYQADLRSWYFSIFTILNGMLKFFIPLLIVILYSRTVDSLLWGIFSAFFVIIIPMLFTYQNLPSFRPTQRLVIDETNKKNNASLVSFFQQFFFYGFPMIGWFLGAELLSIADRYVIQILRDSREVGIYSSNYNLMASAMALITTPLLNAAHPILMKAGTDIATNSVRVQQLIRSFSRYFLILSFPVLTYIVVFSREFANVFLGSEYREGNLVMPIVLIGILIWSFAMFGHKGLEFREKTRIMFYYVIICTVVKIVLNLIFIPWFGYIAAAVTTLVCFTLYPVLVFFGTKRDIPWLIPWRSLGKIVIASLCVAAFLTTLKFIAISSFMKLLIAGIAIIPIYLVALFIFGEFSDDECSFVKRRLGKNA